MSPSLRVAAALGVLCSFPVTLDAELPSFVDRAGALGLTRIHTGGSPQKGYIVEAKGGGVAVIDFDNDGDQDLYWVNGATIAAPDQGGGNALYRNDGTQFADVGPALGASGRGWGMGATSADFDNDGDQDLYLTNLRHNTLYRNDVIQSPDGMLRFADIANRAGVAMPRWSTGAAWADFDLDGDLDLYVANYVEFATDAIERLGAQWQGVEVFVGPRSLPAAPDVLYRNDGDEKFADVTVWARLNHPSPGYGLGVVFADGDGDGWPDIFVANDSSPNFFYRNRGDGRFTDQSLPARLAYGRGGQIQAGMGVAWGDADGDGRPDLFATHFEGEYNTLYRNEGGHYADVSAEAGLAAPSLAQVGFGTSFFDSDNDGDLDLLVVNGHVYPQIDRAGSGSAYAQPDHLYENLGDGQFTLRPHTTAARVSRGAATVDYDDDGDLDLFISHLNDRPALLRNDGGNRHNWLGVKLTGTLSNRDGVGARVRLVAGDRAQFRDLLCGGSFLSSADKRLHFGLGSLSSIDTLEVHWPHRRIQRFSNIAVNRYLAIEEGTADALLDGD